MVRLYITGETYFKLPLCGEAGRAENRRLTGGARTNTPTGLRDLVV